jgi:hypothetical protein
LGSHSDFVGIDCLYYFGKMDERSADDDITIYRFSFNVASNSFASVILLAGFCSFPVTCHNVFSHKLENLKM